MEMGRRAGKPCPLDMTVRLDSLIPRSCSDLPMVIPVMRLWECDSQVSSGM